MEGGLDEALCFNLNKNKKIVYPCISPVLLYKSEIYGGTYFMDRFS